jgi:hypothetical protein
MAEIDEHLSYYREFRAQIAGDLEEYTSGIRTTGEFKDGKPADTTAQTIAELKRRLYKTDQIIAAWEARKAALRT